MEDVLEAAVALSVCKVLCSLPFLHFMSHCHPLSFCCCCLLLFTDVVLTVFLGVLLLLDLWQEVPYSGDVIALRALLLLSHTYGVVFLLMLPALIVDSLVKLLQKKNPPLLGEKNPPLLGKKTSPPLRKMNPPPLREQSVFSYDVGAYLCCLFLWMMGSLSVRWRWRQEEVVTAACVFSSDSLLFCLPNLLTLRFLRLGNVLLLAVTALLAAFLLSRTWTTKFFKPHSGEGAVTISNHFPKRNVELSEERLQENNSGMEQVTPLTEQWTGGVSHESGTCHQACPWVDMLFGGGCLLVLLLLPLNLSVNVPLFISVDRVLQQSVKNIRFSEAVPCHNMDIV